MNTDIDVKPTADPSLEAPPDMPISDVPAEENDVQPAPAPAAPKAASAKDKSKPIALAPLPFMSPPDFFFNRYRIDMQQPIPELHTLNAKAYSVIDEQTGSMDLYALICDRGLPIRLDALKGLDNLRSKYFCNLRNYGVLPISLYNECRYVMILEKPPLVTLAAFLRQQKTMSERQIIKTLLLPITTVLAEFAARKICHGRVNLENIFIDPDNPEIIRLGECFSEPCGYSQPYYYETRERLTTIPSGKGEGDDAVDYFALGVLMLTCVLGANPAQGYEKNVFIERRLSLGSFNSYVGNRELPTMIEDMLKGLLNDSSRDRWNAKHVEAWLSGKKFNLLRPAPPREAPRPYIFEDILHFNRRHLAFSLHQRWLPAKRELRQHRLERWIELTTKMPELAAQLARVVSATGGETGRLPTDDDDLVMKTIMYLDLEGPFRLQNISVHLTGIGPALADALRQNKNNEVHLLKRILESDIITSWAETVETPPGYHSAETAWFLDKRKHIFRLKTYGFGIERILYDLNPGLPCLSPLVYRHHVLNLRELLFSLNSVSEDRRKITDPMDQHIAAFIGSRIELLKEKKSELQEFPQYRNSNALRALSILATAQIRAGNPELPVLSSWIADRIQPILDLLHSRTTRKEVKDKVHHVASQGDLVGILKLVADVGVIKEDQQAFERAMGRYQRNMLRIEKLNERGTLQQRAEALGHRSAFYVSFVVLIGILLRELQG